MLADRRLMSSGSWPLRVYVTDVDRDVEIRVKGDDHIGGVMLKLANEIGLTRDFSDHELWWPDRNIWLKRSRSTLDQYGINASSKIEFTPKHKLLRVQLPDLQYVNACVDYSEKVFKVVRSLTKDLGIRHGEEMSFSHRITRNYLKQNTVISPDVPRTPQDSRAQNYGNTLERPTSGLGRTSPSGHSTLNRFSTLSSQMGSQKTLKEGEKWSPYYPTNPYTTPNYAAPENQPAVLFLDDYTDRATLDASLSDSPMSPTKEQRETLLYPKNLVQKARLNTSWLDSSVSLYEQGVRENDTILLKFKWLTFFDVNPKFDKIRINQIYEQARWQLLSEELDCTEEEMMLFAGLQLQVQLTSNAQEDQVDSGEDEIDAALNDLQMTLEGGVLPDSNPEDIDYVPVLRDTMHFMKPKRFTLKGFRPHYCVLRDTYLTIYKDEAHANGDPVLHANLKGSEISSDVSQQNNKYGIRLEVATADGMQELALRCGNDVQYARWLTACRLAAKGKTMADATYPKEVQQVLDVLRLQFPSAAPSVSANSVNIHAEDYLAPRFSRNAKQDSRQRITEAHANVSRLSHTDAKLHYIKAWQGLRDFGVHYFVAKFSQYVPKKELILAVTSNRIMMLDQNGKHVKTWPYTRMKDWNVNWYKKMVVVSFDEETLEIIPESADSKVVHEFIGGYIFLQLRSKEGSQHLDEEYFHKLTGGWTWETIH